MSRNVLVVDVWCGRLAPNCVLHRKFHFGQLFFLLSSVFLKLLYCFKGVMESLIIKKKIMQCF